MISVRRSPSALVYGRTVEDAEGGMLRSWPWPAPVRLLVGAASGWLVVDALVPWAGPRWSVWVAMAALAVAAVAASGLDRWAGRGVTSGVALVTVAGVYLGPPETDQVLGLALGLAVLWIAEATGRAEVDGLVVLVLDVVLVWAVLFGAVSRPGAVVAGVCMLGLLVVLPVARLLPGPRTGVPGSWQAVALVGLQLVYVVGLARTAARLDSAVDAAIICGAAVVALTVLARLVVGGRSP